MRYLERNLVIRQTLSGGRHLGILCNHFRFMPQLGNLRVVRAKQQILLIHAVNTYLRLLSWRGDLVFTQLN